MKAGEFCSAMAFMAVVVRSVSDDLDCNEENVKDKYNACQRGSKISEVLGGDTSNVSIYSDCLELYKSVGVCYSKYKGQCGYGEEAKWQYMAHDPERWTQSGKFICSNLWLVRRANKCIERDEHLHDKCIKEAKKAFRPNECLMLKNSYDCTVLSAERECKEIKDGIADIIERSKQLLECAEHSGESDDNPAGVDCNEDNVKDKYYTCYNRLSEVFVGNTSKSYCLKIYKSVGVCFSRYKGQCGYGEEAKWQYMAHDPERLIESGKFVCANLWLVRRANQCIERDEPSYDKCIEEAKETFRPNECLMLKNSYDCTVLSAERECKEIKADIADMIERSKQLLECAGHSDLHGLHPWIVIIACYCCYVVCLSMNSYGN